VGALCVGGTIDHGVGAGFFGGDQFDLVAGVEFVYSVEGMAVGGAVAGYPYVAWGAGEGCAHVVAGAGSQGAGVGAFYYQGVHADPGDLDSHQDLALRDLMVDEVGFELE
jgi:hypothetical protein